MRATPDDLALDLRLLGLSDLHATLRAFDYVTGHALPDAGLTRLATLIRAARAEVPNCLLFDNGDLIQGGPLGDWGIEQVAAGAPHPMIGALGALGTDAATLGNHEFNYGLDLLRASYAGATFPVVCANALCERGPTPVKDRTLFPPWTILERELADRSGGRHRLRIGVIGALPPQILAWDDRHLAGRLQTRGIAEAVAGHLPAMQAAGADLVVVLSHSGLGADCDDPALEQAARPLARLPGVAAVIAGHAHLMFPGPDYPAGPAIDTRAGTVHGTPLVMPGAFGSHLGVIDLTLTRPAGEPGTPWRITERRASLRPVHPPGCDPVPEDPALLSWSASAHEATLARTARPVGRSRLRLHTYFAMLEAGPALGLLAEAQAAALARLVRGSPHAGLPLLAAVSPFKCGGRSGPEHYTDVPAGGLHMGNLADLYAYPNSLAGVAVTGAALKEWLERAAGAFRSIRPGSHGQRLLDNAMPGYEFDCIFGVTYSIDLTAPRRYEPATGKLVNPRAERIQGLSYRGRPVSPEDRFLVATNNYRVGGGGNFPGLRGAEMVAESPASIRDLLQAHLAKAEVTAALPSPWSFAIIRDASAVLATAPAARTADTDITRLGLTDLGTDAQGFALFEYPLG